jgi:uncharacterized BrkB/YihY/UPF0761 family membrane protein
MTERDTRSGKTQDSPGATEQQRAQNAKAFFATIVCVVGLVLAVGVLISTLVSGGSFGVVSAAAVGVGLGILGYYLGAGRLGTVTIIVAIVTLFWASPPRRA